VLVPSEHNTFAEHPVINVTDLLAVVPVPVVPEIC